MLRRPEEEHDWRGSNRRGFLPLYRLHYRKRYHQLQKRVRGFQNPSSSYHGGVGDGGSIGENSPEEKMTWVWYQSRFALRLVLG